ncbi:MAG: helix-turn-helix domain-containing protein [Haloferacaceae archaeon]
MPRATLTLTLPDAVWIGGLSRRHPETRFRILAAMPDEETGVGLTEITGEHLDAVLDEMRAESAVARLDVLQRGEETALVQFETTAPLLLGPLRESGVPLETPFDLVDGSLTWEVTAPHERLSALGERLEALGVPFTLDRLRQQVDDGALLTDRQATVLETAVEHGYYDTPRECTLTELAGVLGVAKSTCSETLHRAEETVVKRFVERRAHERDLQAEA